MRSVFFATAICFAPLPLACATESQPSSDSVTEGATTDTSGITLVNKGALTTGVPRIGEQLKCTAYSRALDLALIAHDPRPYSVGGFPADFWMEVGVYTLVVKAGDTIEIAATGPKLATVFKRLPASDLEETEYVTVVENAGAPNTFTYAVPQDGRYLIRVVPLHVDRKSDHVTFDLTARVTPPNAQ